MEKKNNKGSVPFLGVLAAICFAFLVCFIPTGYAQTPASNVEKETKTRQYMELLNSVFSFVLQNYVDETDPSVLYEGALKGMMDSLEDPYTTYLDYSQMRSLTDTTQGNFGGVGLSITKAVDSTPEKPAYVEVASPIEDTPGWKAGIQTGDLIITIDGESTAEITMDDVLTKLRGEIGKPVELGMRRKNADFTVTLVRALIEVPTVKYGMLTEKGRKTGYLRIIEFTPQTPERVQNALDSFVKAGFDSLVIDLRNNPGGLITSVADVADKFIDKGIIVSTKSRLKYENSVFQATPKNTTMPKNIPIVVLINRGSASASEILSGALKDYHLAYLVGERTYGKGSVQQVVPLPNSDGIKLTMARYYTPSDTNIDKIGIPPDYEVLFPALSEEEEQTYVTLMTSTVISDYIGAHPNMTNADITAYAETLSKEYPLEGRVLRRLVRLEIDKYQNGILYDLDFDLQLNAALDLLNKKDFFEMVKAGKTLKELQAEVDIEEEEK